MFREATTLDDLSAYQEIEDHLERLQNIIKNCHSLHFFNEVFRLVHSIKGTAQMIENKTLAFNFHHFEDYLININEADCFLEQKFLNDFYDLIDLSYRQIEKVKDQAA